MIVDPNIFKAYDIRGVYPEQLDANTVRAIGRAYAKVVSPTSPVVVGRDMRASSIALRDALIEALLECGVDVVDIDLVSTPTFYSIAAESAYAGGIQISASHNPKEWNGLKLVRAGAVPISKDTGILEIKRLIESDNLPSPADIRGVLTERSGTTADTLKEQAPSTAFDATHVRPLSVCIDTASGMGALDLEQLFAALPQVKVEWMNKELDGSFPSHPADPMVAENTKDLRERLRAGNFDLGIASDGDGDRYFFFDERGEVIPQEILRGIIAKIMLQRNPGARIVYDIRPGRITKDIIAEAGGQAILAPVGHSLIKEVMIREGALFGAESSGHYFFKLPNGTFEAPMILTYLFIEFLSSQGAPLSKIVEPYRVYSNSGEINTKLDSREQGLQRLLEIEQRYSDGEISKIDGLSVEYPDFWFSVRLSNTEPLIRLIVEAKDEKTMTDKRDELLALLNS